MSEQDLRKLIRKNIEVTEENNRILRKLHRSNQWNQALTTLKWVAILIAIYLGYIALQPYLDVVVEAYNSISANLQEINETKDSLLDLEVFPR